VSIEDLRQIAGEAGISMESFDTAVMSLNEPDPPAAADPAEPIVPAYAAFFDQLGLPIPGRTIVNLLRTTSLAASAAVLGFFGGLGDEAVTIPAIIILGIMGLASIRHHRRAGTLWNYQMDNAWMWLAFALAWGVGNGRFDDDVAAVLTSFWAGFASFGGLLVVKPWQWLRDKVRPVSEVKRGV
jgi:hypothetical protein